MGQTFEEMQREVLLEKYRILREENSKLKYQLEMANRDIKFKEGIISEYEKLNEER